MNKRTQTSAAATVAQGNTAAQSNTAAVITTPRVYAGVDVGKQALDVCVDGGRAMRFDNSKAGIKRLITHVKRYAVDVVVCEASGGYERRLLRMLDEAQIPSRRLHANYVRSYAQAIGRLAKTDRIDAMVLCDYATRLAVTAVAPPDASDAWL